MRKLLINLIFLLMANALFAQRGIVEGTMTDNNGDPIPGASITIKGSKQATFTDMDGKYKIECNVGDILVISFIGYSTQEKKVEMDMFKTVLDPTVQVKIVEEAVIPIKNKVYSDLVRKNKPDSGNFIRMGTSHYEWKYTNLNSNYLYSQNYKTLRQKDSVFEFVTGPYPVYYEIEFDTYTTIKSILNMPSLQNEYAQGRPSAGETTWFGADNNEAFAWGPKIANLAFDGSDYVYDKNGRLVPVSPSYTTPAKAYNPYDIFKTGLILKNALKLTSKWRENEFDLSYTRRDEKGNLDVNKINADLFNMHVKRKWDRHVLKAGFNYFAENDKFANINGLWANTLAAIMLTPPTFDNTQAYQFADLEQRSSAPDFTNNPYFLMNKTNIKQKNSTISGLANYDLDLDAANLGISINYSNNLYRDMFFMPLNAIGFTESYAQEKEIRQSDLNLQLTASNKHFGRFYFWTSAIMNFENMNYLRLTDDATDLNIKRHRNSLDWMQYIKYRFNNSNFINTTINFKNTVYITAGHQKWFLPTVGFKYDFMDLFHRYVYNFQRLNISFNYSRSVAELPLFQQNKSHQTLLTDLGQMNGFLENHELFYDQNLDLEIRQSLLCRFEAIGSNLFGFLTYSVDFEYARNTNNNSIFPVLNGGSFELANIAKIRNSAINLNLKLMTGRYHRTNWDGTLVFLKSNLKVLELNNGLTQVPIAGFQSVSRNLVVGQPVGVIIGSAYQRNEQGQLVIGNDGFPLLAADRKIIGNPNPDFYLAFENKLSFRNKIVIDILIDYQKGGDIWNGTKNMLSYYGMSQNTADERQVTNYIFQGVNQSGEVNTIPVDFANPANGLEGNRWYRTGIGGVAEDAIEDGSWFRIKEIAIYYKPINNHNNFIREFSIKLFVNNLWIKTKYSGASPLSWFNNYGHGQGLDYFNMPVTREFGVGVSLKI